MASYRDSDTIVLSDCSLAIGFVYSMLLLNCDVNLCWESLFVAFEHDVKLDFNFEFNLEAPIFSCIQTLL